MDYTPGPYNVTIPAGQKYAAFDIAINDDDNPEDDENFMLTINASSLPMGAFIGVGNQYQATVTILDDDSKL